MINWLIEASLRNRFLVVTVCLLVGVWGYWALSTTPIDAIPDPDEAFKAATRFADQARNAHTRIAGRFHRLRVRQAVRIKDQESLSIAQLASRISVSKARADQLLRKAEEATP